MTGSMAKTNPYRFSTKYQDDETDLLYYGYRYYSASTGRWLSSDPIGEEGGPNLYSAFLNDAVDYFDPLGDTCECATAISISGEPYKKDVRGLPGGVYGHHIKVVIQLEYAECGNGKATLIWEENFSRGNVPRNYGDKVKPRTWVDIAAPENFADWFIEWNSRDYWTSPGVRSVTINDYAQQALIWPARTLQFAIRVENPKGCACRNVSVSVGAQQVLEPTSDNPPQVKVQEFQIYK